MTRLAPHSSQWPWSPSSLAVGGPSLPVASGADAGGRRAARRRHRSGRLRAPAAAIDAEQRVFRRELAARLPAARARLALPSRRERLLGHAPERRARGSGALPGVRDVLPTGSYAPRLDLDAAGDRRARDLGPVARHRGSRNQDRDHRLGDRPLAPLLRPDRLHHACRIPEGSATLHDCEGDRRAGLPAEARAIAPIARLASFSDDDSSPRNARRRDRSGQCRHRDRPAGRASGVAPRAYLGNYKVFVQTDSGISPNANSPAIVAAIEAAVRDGMDVINFSGGEPEIEPSRDIVALALDAAAAAGVVPVDRRRQRVRRLRAGSVSSPASSNDAISVAAVEISGSPVDEDACRVLVRRPDDDLAPAQARCRRPGCGRLVVRLGRGLGRALGNEHGLASRRGSRCPASRASPLVVGRAAPSSALVQSGVDSAHGSGRAAGPRFQGGGVVALQRADRPLALRASQPACRSVSSRADGAQPTRVGLEDAGGGSGTWQVARIVRKLPQESGSRCPQRSRCPESSRSSRPCRAAHAPGDLDAYIELRRGADARRIPLWGRVTRRVARTSRGRDAGAARHLPKHHRGQPVLRLALPLPGIPARSRRDDGPARPGARVPDPPHEARRQLWRRHHPARYGAAAVEPRSSPGSTRTA